jgi:hypothetical protein
MAKATPLANAERRQSFRTDGGSGSVAIEKEASLFTQPVSDRPLRRLCHYAIGYQKPPAVPGPVWAAIEGPMR